MPERFARIAALALIVVLILALPLLISLFGALNAPTPTRIPPTQLAQATRTSPPPLPSPLPPTTIPPILAPSPSPTSGCPIPATPEPLWVNPVLSPTNLLSQKISVTLGRGREITIASEAGTVTQQGDFSIARPVELEIPLVSNAQNNLLVTGRVEYAAECSYTLQTRVDRVGNPLVIVQSSLGVLSPTDTPTPPAPGIVFLKPFSQVFALNQDKPTLNNQLYLYTGETNAAFQILAQEGAFSHLLSQSGTLNFWTLNDNLALTPSPEPKYDTTFSGRRLEFVSDKIFACEGQYPRNLILGFCAELAGVTTGEVIQSVQVDASVLYMVRVNNKLYWVSSNVLKQEPQ